MGHRPLPKDFAELGSINNIRKLPGKMLPLAFPPDMGSLHHYSNRCG